MIEPTKEPAAVAHAAIVRFLAQARRPAVVEPGGEVLLLTADCYCIELEGNRLLLQAWDEHQNLARRVTGVVSENPGHLDVAIEKFGKRTGSLTFTDLARPKSAGVSQKAARRTYAEHFRRSLLRQFPGWTIQQLSTDPDLQRSLSPSYPRAFLRKGATGWAAIGAGPDALDPDGALTFGLIWLDLLRQRERDCRVVGLSIFLPEDSHQTTCLRLRHLRSDIAQWQVYLQSDSYEEPVDLRNGGNLDTSLPVCKFAQRQEHESKWETALGAIPHVRSTERTGGGLSFRVRGFEFAYTAGTKLFYGIDGKRQARTLGEVEALAKELARMRSPQAVDRHNPLYTRYPELWLEAEVRSSIRVIDAGLHSSPVYGQVPAFAGGDRGVIDLLAAGHDGVLAVIELKASEDIHLPLQSLDYWMRVRWHASQAEFTPAGYFPGIALAVTEPKLYLAAPALAFHPSTETILRYFPSGLEVVRLGLGMDWQRELKVVFRAEGSEHPGGRTHWPHQERSDDCEPVPVSRRASSFEAES